jgi:hypothetical protein
MERVCMACRRSWASDEVLRRIISRRIKVVGKEIIWGMGGSLLRGNRRRGVR